MTQPCQQWICLALAMLLAVIIASVSGAGHWTVTHKETVERAEYFLYNPVNPLAPTLVSFLQHGRSMDYFRDQSKKIDRALYDPLSNSTLSNQSLPDLLSKMKDYEERLSLAEMALNISIAAFPAHQGVRTSELMDLSTPLARLPKRRPSCNSFVDYRVTDFLHLPSLGQSLKAQPEPALLYPAWLDLNDGNGTALELGVRIAHALQDHTRSWELYTLAATFWRVQGDHETAVQCLRRALHYAPPQYRHVPILNLGAVLMLAGHYKDSLILADACTSRRGSLYGAYLLQAILQIRLHDPIAAIQSIRSSLIVTPNMKLSLLLQEGLYTDVKRDAVVARRDYEINIRRMTMVLPPELTWADFDYEAIEDLCKDAICREDATCNPLSGKCHCNEGWKVSGGQCVKDPECDNIQCREFSTCREGRCYCNIGYKILRGGCVPDLCAGVSCVDHAVCNPDSGRCECQLPYAGHGPICVQGECLGVTCRQHSFCQRGLCYCRVGYHPDGDACVADQPCLKSRCPNHAHCEEDGHCRCDEGYHADIQSNACQPSAVGLVQTKAAADALERRNKKAEAEKSGAETSDKNDEIAQARPAGSLVRAQITRPSFEAYNNDTFVYADDFATEETCVEHFKKPHWTDYASTYIPPYQSANKLVSDLLAGTPFPTLREQATVPFVKPFCNVSNVTFSVAMMDHVYGVTQRSTANLNRVYKPELGLRDMIALLFNDMTPLEFGHRVTHALQADPNNWRLYSLATLYWRVMGSARSALTCVRYALHYAPLEERDGPMLDAVNVLHRAGQLSNATFVGNIVQANVRYHHSLAHFTSGNVLAARNMYKEAEEQYVQALRYQSSATAELATQRLKHVRCVLQFASNTLEYMEDVDIEKTEDKIARHRADLRKHVLEARELREKLNGLKELVAEHGDGPETDMLREQLADAESRLESVFERQRQEEENLVSTTSAFSGVHYRLRHRQAEQMPEVTSKYKALSHDGTEQALPALQANAASSGVPASPRPATDKLHEYTDADGQRVIVVEYPKSPSIPSLMVAVEDMFGPLRTNDVFFRQPGWPAPAVCDKFRTAAPIAANFSQPLEGFAEAVADGKIVEQMPYNDEGYGTVMSKALLRQKHDPMTELLPNMIEGHEPMRIRTITRNVSIVIPAPRYVSIWINPETRADPIRPLFDFDTPDADLLSGLDSLPPTPICDGPVSSKKVHSLQHLSGVLRSAELRMTPERALEPLFQTLHETDKPLYQRRAMTMRAMALRLTSTLERHPSDWRALNYASLYWRVMGNATQAIECLRRAFYHSPSDHKDVALLGLGSVLHRSLHSVDAITVVQMAIQLAPKKAVSHFTMATVLAALEGRADEEAIFFYETALTIEPEFLAAQHRLEFLRCKADGVVEQPGPRPKADVPTPKDSKEPLAE
eukprot:m.202248 g.202248  ORF g.202248 m.202248 type:complete len:1413 (+) comp17063_c0_seq1:158-4396(+)